MPDTDQFDFSVYDYVVDAIDTVTRKLQLVEQAYRTGTKIISSMGAGNKMDARVPFQVARYFERVSAAGKVMRRGSESVASKALVVYSTEPPIEPSNSSVSFGSIGGSVE